MPRDVPARDVMTTEVLTFAVHEPITAAMQRLVDNGVDAGPVVDDDGKVVGMLSTGDLIVQESQLHYPTVINILGRPVRAAVGQEAVRARAGAGGRRRRRGRDVPDPSPAGPTTPSRRPPP